MRPRRFLAVLALALAVVAFPLGALASHDFGDVPDSNPFHADISALVASGVTSGCGGGNYCPSANVTREQMAAFLNRLGALAPGKTPVVNATKLDGLDSSQFERSDVAVNGHAGCSGSSMVAEETTDTTVSDTARYVTTSSDGIFYCTFALPDQATITGLAGTFYAASTGSGYCELWRATLASGVASVIASTPGTSDSGGWQTVSDTSVTTPDVDNGAFMYVGRCFLDTAGETLRLLSVQVSYTSIGVSMP